MATRYSGEVVLQLSAKEPRTTNPGALCFDWPRQSETEGPDWRSVRASIDYALNFKIFAQRRLAIPLLIGLD